MVMLEGKRKQCGQAATDVHPTYSDNLMATSDTIRKISSLPLELRLPPENPYKCQITVSGTTDTSVYLIEVSIVP